MVDEKKDFERWLLTATRNTTYRECSRELGVPQSSVSRNVKRVLAGKGLTAAMEAAIAHYRVDD